MVMAHQRLRCSGLSWACLVQKNNLGSDVNDSFGGRNDKDTENNQQSEGDLSKQDGLIGLEREEAELVAMEDYDG